MARDNPKSKKAAAPPESQAIPPSRRPIPTYPIGPSTLEITVLLRVAGGQIQKWEGDVKGSTVITDDGAGGDDPVKAAQAALFSRQLASSRLPADERNAIVCGSVDFTQAVLPDAHKAQVHLVGDEALPDWLLGADWKSGRIGVPKGTPAVRIVNLTRPER